MFGRTMYIILSALIVISGSAVSQDVVDRIVAVVDDEIILESELNSQVQMFAMQQRIDQRHIPELRKQMLESLVNKRLLLAQAIRDSIVISDAEIQQEVDNQLRQFEQAYGSIDQVAQTLGITIPRLRREIREDIRKELLVQRLQGKIFARMNITRREVEEFYHKYRNELPPIPEQVEVYHIFMIPEEDTDIREIAFDRARSIRDSILAGADFAEMAARYSKDPGSSGRGGDLGWVRRGVFVREFEEVVFAMNPGELSDIVETQFGLHIIRLDERRGDAVRPRHILLRIERTEESDQPTIEKLSELRERVRQGESFEDLAREYSQDTDTAPFGGRLGLVPIDQLDSETRRVIAQLNEGEISQPSRISFGERYGYSIIRLKQRIPEHPVDIEKDWKFLEQYALQYKMERKFQELIEKLREDIHWEIRL